MRNLSREALFDKLAFNAVLALIGLVLLVISLQKAPISTDYIKLSLINGGLCALIVFFLVERNPVVVVFISMFQVYACLYELPRHFSKDILHQNQGWLIAQWLAISCIPFLIATYIVVIRNIRKFDVSVKEKPMP